MTALGGRKESRWRLGSLLPIRFPWISQTFSRTNVLTAPFQRCSICIDDSHEAVETLNEIPQASCRSSSSRRDPSRISPRTSHLSSLLGLLRHLCQRQRAPPVGPQRQLPWRQEPPDQPPSRPGPSGPSTTGEPRLRSPDSGTGLRSQSATPARRSRPAAEAGS